MHFLKYNHIVYTLVISTRIDRRRILIVLAVPRVPFSAILRHRRRPPTAVEAAHHVGGSRPAIKTVRYFDMQCTRPSRETKSAARFPAYSDRKPRTKSKKIAAITSERFLYEYASAKDRGRYTRTRFE